MRRDYRVEPLREDDLAPTWVEQFDRWFTDAVAAELPEPNAVVVATADADGNPDARLVLVKGYDSSGFVFGTSYASTKGAQLAANPRAALLFHWKSLRRQVRVEGKVEPVSDAEADAYFATRPRDSRIGAWASQQSRPLESRFTFEKAIAVYAAKYAVGEVPRPPYWTGLRIAPVSIEFWHDRPFRLHDRISFTREGNGWGKTRLYP